MTTTDLYEAKQLPLPDRDRPLDEAIKDFAERVWPGGPYGGIDGWSGRIQGRRHWSRGFHSNISSASRQAVLEASRFEFSIEVLDYI